MNEGESAGGGHQGSNPAPPAVPDRISSTTTNSTTATNLVASTPKSHVYTAASTPSSSSLPSQLSPSSAPSKPLKIAGNIPASNIASAEAVTSCDLTGSPSSTSPTPRSFQQAFAQHQLQIVDTAAAPTAASSSPSSTVAANQSKSLMPQTSTSYQQQQAATTTTDLSAALSVTKTVAGFSSNEVTSPLIKRKKLEDNPASGSSSGILLANTSIGGGVGGSSNSIVGSLLPTTINNTATSKHTASNAAGASLAQDIQGLKKRILEQKYSRLRRLKEKHSENVAELFYLQTGGNMMDYPTWRKKAPTPQFITFSNAYRLDQQLVNDERTAAAANTTTATPTSTVTAATVATGATTTATQQQLLQQQTPVADNIATIIGVTASSHTTTIATTNQQQTNTQSHQQSSLIVSSYSSPASHTSSLVSNHGRLPSSTTLSSTLSSSSASSSATAAAATLSSSSTTSATSSLSLPTAATDASGNPLPPQGAEIKIPAVGATPVAVSTKLPAAVQQLTQQGGTPLIPCSTAQGTTALRRNGNGVVSTSNTPPPLYSPTPSGVLVPAGTASAVTAAAAAAAAAAASSSATTPNSNQEFSFKAKQEVDVMRRIMELQREGLWTEKRLPKQLEPPRPKAHWDYLLEEMVWLAADFAQERKWKKAAAKKCAKMVQKYFQDKANAAQKAEKAQEAHLRRVAAFIAKEVKMFWGNVEKLVEYKHNTKLEEKRKKALDQHLSFIVDQTEKFSQQLAEGMNKGIKDVSTNPSINSSRISSPKRDATDDEFRPESASEDDEETIAKAEEEERADVSAEVAALEKESQMDLDDFLKDLPKGYLENRDKIVLEEDTATTSSSMTSKGSNKKTDTNDSDDGEFEANETSEDDENTISKQEQEEMDVDYQKELNELEADNDLTVEELLAKYKSGKIDKTTTPANKALSRANTSKMQVDSDDDETIISKAMRDSDDDSTDEDDLEEDDEEDEESADETEDDDEIEENEHEEGLKSLLEDSSNANSSKDDMIKDAAALAESLQPKGNTLSSTNVVTPVPFLLKHSLREYQHIGLDWLVTMNERKLNGILADEMGLGKTIQTIALLAHLACVKGNWGPHLIVVPSSVMLNWEMEFKKWCPGFKILTYYGSQKERKLKRVGWTKPNAFHVCITSYKLVVQDQQSFRRKKWKYLILDEAQNIKNFKSQRWQLLLNFSTERRLLLTGTPLQNDLMELWSLMHFLMPYVFSSHREFKEWFSNPMTGMIEGNMEYNETLIQRLHKVIRPFLLRRLKKEVEKQMPKKYEHVVMCRLSNRQRYLYEDFMSRAKTRETLQTGNLLSVINILMQLRKVCNHPNMFEVRPTISPFQMEGISYETSRLICDLMDYDPFTHIDLHTINLFLIDLELTLTAYVSHKSRLLAAPRKLIEEIDSIPDPPPRCPTGKYKFHIRVRDVKVQDNIYNHTKQTVKVGASPAMRQEGNKFVPVHPSATTSTVGGAETANSRISKRINNVINPIDATKWPITPVCITRSKEGVPSSSSLDTSCGPTPAKQMRLQDPLSLEGMQYDKGIKVVKSSDDKALVKAFVQQVKASSDHTVKTEPDEVSTDDDNSSELDPVYNMSEILQQRKEQRLARLKQMANNNKKRSEATPIYGADCRESIKHCMEGSRLLQYSTWQTRGYTNCNTAMARRNDNWTLNKILKPYERRCGDLKNIFQNYVIYVPSACAPRIRFYVSNLTSTSLSRERFIENSIQKQMSPKLTMLHPIISAMTTQFPDPRLIQYDCGKLQTLDRLLKQLKSGHHRVLIFTQMTKMLDVLEAFLNHHGHIYLRLDGATKVEQRQLLMERFNSDKRVFVFILSTRSGGVGINLTGADTVIFYDSDWNPTMDAQAQDRCHRIGQTRDVHIYRLVSEKTIEVNILKKANQKRMLSDMAIEGGNFTTSYFKSSTIKDLFNIDTQQQSESTSMSSIQVEIFEKPASLSSATSSSTGVVEIPEVDLEKQSLRAFESALAAAEDEQDVQATKTAKAEVAADLAEFDENIPLEENIGGNTADANTAELSKADLEMQNLVKQLSPIERYAMRFVEETGAAWTAEQLRAAEEEIEAQKREWEANRLAALQKEEEMLKQEAEPDEVLTYSRKDATNQVNKQNKNNKASNKRTNITRNNKTTTSSNAATRRRMQQLRNRKVAGKVSRRGVGGGRRISSRQRNQQNVQKKLGGTVTNKKQNQRQQRRSRTNRNSRGSLRVEDNNSEEEVGVEEDFSSNAEEDDDEVAAASDTADGEDNSQASDEDEDKVDEVGDTDDNDDDDEDAEETENNTEDDDEKYGEDNNEELDDRQFVSRSRLRSLRRSDTSGSFNKSPKKTATARNNSLSQPSKSTANRKTTRTSMAAAKTGISVQQRVTKASFNKKNKSASSGRGVVKTGVKNQRLLGIARKRLQQKRQEEARSKRASQLKRKSSLSSGKCTSGSQAKRRSTLSTSNSQRVLRHSPRKANQKTKANDTEEEEHDASDDDDEDEDDSNNEGEDEDNSQATDDQPNTAEEEDELCEDEQNNRPKLAAASNARRMPLRSRGGKTMKVETDDEQENDKDEEFHHSNGEEDDKSSYATAADNIEEDEKDNANVDAGNSSSMDTWNVHNQMQDTTTNSTYYNVSDESESDNDNETLTATLNSSAKKTPLSNIKTHNTVRSSFVAKGAAGCGVSVDTDMASYSTPVRGDNHTPRTRSRGSVKINLWNLDDSPVLHSSSHSRETGKHNKPQQTEDEQIDKDSLNPHRTPTLHQRSSTIRRPLNVTRSTETPTKSPGNVTTLHRWLLKTPRSSSSATATVSQENGPNKSTSETS